MRGPFEIISSLGLPPITGILQVGASNGQEVPYFLANGVNLATLVEPLDGPFAALRERCQNLAGYLPVQALCGERDGEKFDFYIASNNGESSSILKPTSVLRDYPWLSFPRVVSMETFTLDRVFAAVQVARPDIASGTNMLFMDVQGAELKVLAGAPRVLQTVSYIYTETGDGDGYEGAGELLHLLNFVRPFNFKIYELESDKSGWGNAMLIKRTDR